jgi:hypothetical protein
MMKRTAWFGLMIAAMAVWMLVRNYGVAEGALVLVAAVALATADWLVAGFREVGLWLPNLFRIKFWDDRWNRT